VWTAIVRSSSESDQVHAGERVVDLLHRAACRQVAEVDPATPYRAIALELPGTGLTSYDWKKARDRSTRSCLPPAPPTGGSHATSSRSTRA
jgi:hypothetical protein